MYFRVTGCVCGHSGHTFCTVERFENVAVAVAETAFENSELPVILSLEMHCGPKQQHKLATMLLEHLGVAVLRVSCAIHTSGHHWVACV